MIEIFLKRFAPMRQLPFRDTRIDRPWSKETELGMRDRLQFKRDSRPGGQFPYKFIRTRAAGIGYRVHSRSFSCDQPVDCKGQVIGVSRAARHVVDQPETPRSAHRVQNRFEKMSAGTFPHRPEKGRTPDDQVLWPTGRLFFGGAFTFGEHGMPPFAFRAGNLHEQGSGTFGRLTQVNGSPSMNMVRGIGPAFEPIKIAETRRVDNHVRPQVLQGSANERPARKIEVRQVDRDDGIGKPPENADERVAEQAGGTDDEDRFGRRDGHEYEKDERPAGKYTGNAMKTNVWSSPPATLTRP